MQIGNVVALRAVGKGRSRLVVACGFGVCALGLIIVKVLLNPAAPQATCTPGAVATAYAAQGSAVTTPLAGLAQAGMQDYAATSAYNPTEVAQLKQMRQAGADVIRYGNVNLWAYAPAPASPTRAARARAGIATQVAQLNGLGYTVDLDVAADADRYGYVPAGAYPVDTPNAAAYGTAVANLASQYGPCGGNITYFELGNEPDLNWYPAAANASVTPVIDVQASAQNYVRALATFSATVKAAVPGAVISNGGVAYDRAPAPIGDSKTWFTAALDAGLGRQSDVIAFHFYPNAWYTPLGYPTLGSKIADISALLHTPRPGYAPVNKVLWLNESGLTSNNDDLSIFPGHANTNLTVEAGELARINAEGAAQDVAGGVWFLFHDYEQSGDPYQHSGLIADTTPAVPKPAFAALLAFDGQIGTGAAVNAPGYPAGVASDLTGYTFRNSPAWPQRLVSVLWANQPGATAVYTVPAQMVDDVDIVLNTLGTPLAAPTPPPGQPWPLSVSHEPLYIKWKTSFADVATADPFFSAIDALAQRGVVSGYGDGTFGPNNGATRAQAAKLITLAAGWTLLEPGTPSFADMQPDTAFYPYVETARSHGALAGFSDTGHCGPRANSCFLPERTLTRGEWSKIIVLAAGWALPKLSAASFNDVPAGSDFYAFIEAARAHGAVDGYSDAAHCGSVAPPCFLPAAGATRGQIAKGLALVFNIQSAPPPTPTLIQTPATRTPSAATPTRYIPGPVNTAVSGFIGPHTSVPAPTLPAPQPSSVSELLPPDTPTP